jgi:hypothetical protein
LSGFPKPLALHQIIYKITKLFNLKHSTQYNMKFFLMLSLAIMAHATGVYLAICTDDNGDTDYQVSKDCCAAISGKLHSSHYRITN